MKDYEDQSVHSTVATLHQLRPNLMAQSLHPTTKLRSSRLRNKSDVRNAGTNKTHLILNGAVSSGLHLGHEQNRADCALDVA